MPILALLLTAAALAVQDGGIEAFQPQGFSASFNVEIAAPPETVFDAATGDITGWWDHSFSGDPAELVIEPWLGGRFYERLHEGSDDGALHATVIYVEAPSALRLHGPLGLSGRSIDLVTSWQLSPVGVDATAFEVRLNMTGQLDADTARLVLATWEHFIIGRLKPYVEAGCYTAPQEPCAAWDE